MLDPTPPPPNMHKQFEQHVLALQPRLYAHSRRYQQLRNDREDLVQDTLFKAFRYQNQFRDGGNVFSWLCGIMRNQFLDDNKRRKHEPPASGDMVDHLLIELPNQQWVLHMQDVGRRIGCMPEKQRVALLEIGAGSSYEDAAVLIGCEIGTVKTWVSRARRILADEMGDIFLTRNAQLS
jgi:RNA polymerase sigma factor (sigma-70 family)